MISPSSGAFILPEITQEDHRIHFLKEISGNTPYSNNQRHPQLANPFNAMPATEIRPRKAAKPFDPKLLETARQAIKNTDWDAYWRKVDEGVARDAEAYANARAKSWEEFSHQVLR